MPSWPSYACILVEGYGEEPDYGVLRDEMDGGIAQQRATLTSPTVARDITFAVFSDADKLRFDQWIKDDLQGGVLYFNLVVPRTSTTVLAQIVGGRYRWGKPEGQIWKAICQIEAIGL